MYKLIAIDIDGTLVTSKGDITEQTLIVLKKCMDMGIHVTISTGRSVQGAEILVDQLGLRVPYITYNGSMIIDANKDRLYEERLEVDDARQIILLGEERNTTMIIWSNNQLYVNKTNAYVEDYKVMSGGEAMVVKDYDALLRQGITKIIWIDLSERISDYGHEMAVTMNANVTFCTSKSNFLEFFNSKVSKGKALGKVARMLGVNRTEIIAIGDGDNDISMLEYAGVGVAMANASTSLIKVADFITASNDEDGVKLAIEKYLLDIVSQ